MEPPAVVNFVDEAGKVFGGVGPGMICCLRQSRRKKWPSEGETSSLGDPAVPGVGPVEASSRD